MQRVLGQVPEAGSSIDSHENMSIISKIVFMYVICNVVPRRKGREKIAIEDYLLVNEILKQKPIFLQLIVMKHLPSNKSKA